MTFTPIEARSRRCCGPNWNSVQQPGGDCVAEQCMAWRWVPAEKTDARPEQGYCGLAGRP